MTELSLSGILVIDKPLGWTSHDVVGLVRRLARLKQVGHAGTLDPLATGVLLVMLGQATRLSDYLMHGQKCYHARVRLGEQTTTDDAEGEVIARQSTDALTQEQILAALRSQCGAIAQRPPAFAAIKKDGVPAYKLARQGQAPVMELRQVTIEALALTAWTTRELDLLIWCSAGTYIRALARDLGEILGCGAHLSYLRRLSSGRFTVREAVDLTTLRRLAQQEALGSRLLPPDSAVEDWPALVMTEEQERAVAHGNAISGPEAGEESQARLYSMAGKMHALARYDLAHHHWQPIKVFVSGPQSSESALH